MMKFLLIVILFHIAIFTLLFPIIRLYGDSFITPVIFITRLTQSKKFFLRNENISYNVMKTRTIEKGYVIRLWNEHRYESPHFL